MCFINTDVYSAITVSPCTTITACNNPSDNHNHGYNNKMSVFINWILRRSNAIEMMSSALANTLIMPICVTLLYSATK